MTHCPRQRSDSGTSEVDTEEEIIVVMEIVVEVAIWATHSQTGRGWKLPKTPVVGVTPGGTTTVEAEAAIMTIALVAGTKGSLATATKATTAEAARAAGATRALGATKAHGVDRATGADKATGADRATLRVSKEQETGAATTTTTGHPTRATGAAMARTRAAGGAAATVVAAVDMVAAAGTVVAAATRATSRGRVQSPHNAARLCQGGREGPPRTALCRHRLAPGPDPLSVRPSPAAQAHTRLVPAAPMSARAPGYPSQSHLVWHRAPSGG